MRLSLDRLKQALRPFDRLRVTVTSILRSFDKLRTGRLRTGRLKTGRLRTGKLRTGKLRTGKLRTGDIILRSLSFGLHAQNIKVYLTISKYPSIGSLLMAASWQVGHCVRS